MRAISLVFISTLLSSTAFAADPGTYRPGMAYGSVPASEPAICEAQCSGDAQCRGWNFVKVNPRLQSGVCEFNAQDAAPVPSPYSISGSNSAAPRSATIIPGRSNTVRVGDIGGSITAPAPTVSQPSPTRRIVREAVPNQIQPRTAATRRVTPNNMQHLSLTEQQNLQRSSAQQPGGMQRPSAAPQAAPHMRQPAKPQTRPQQRPQFQHSLDARQQQVMRPQIQQHMMQRPQGAQNQGAQNQGLQHQNYQGDPRLQQRILQQRQQQPAQAQQPHSAPALQPQASASASAPQLSEQGRATPPIGNIAPNPRQMMPRTPTQQPAQPIMQRPVTHVPAEMGPRAANGTPLSTAEAQASLFGSLYDDVKIPRPIDPQAYAANPDAPIPTVANVPTRPISQVPLPNAEQPNVAGLAGPAR